MAIPDFQSLMRPLLEHLSHGAEHANKETLSVLADRLALTEDERSELLPSGRQAVFTNRIAWAKSHLKHAGLVDSPKRGVYRITDRGRRLLQDHSGAINLRMLGTFPEYQAFRAGTSQEAKEQEQSAGDEPETVMTPHEMIEYGYREMRSQLAASLLASIKICPPEFFERLVVELLLAMGYGGSRADAGRAIGRSGDGGIDGIIKEDRLGLAAIYVQAKRWDGRVGRPDVQAFAGALQGQRARKGVFITTSDFSEQAVDFTRRIDNKIVLIGGTELAELMMDHGIGVTTVATYTIRRIDNDYFEPE